MKIDYSGINLNDVLSENKHLAMVVNLIDTLPEMDLSAVAADLRNFACMYEDNVPNEETGNLQDKSCTD